MEKSKSFKLPVWVEPSLWGVVVGAAVCWVTLSSGFGWMSEGTAKKMAVQQTQEAVVAYATPACVARFEKQPNAVDAWKVLKKTDSWSQGDVIKKGGWVTEPGQKLDSVDIADTIARNCATQLVELKTLGGVKLPTE
ncbi:MAG: hypothetical protein Q8P17_02550 [bacterium]|nr:hypothetical protein [bacterium]